MNKKISILAGVVLSAMVIYPLTSCKDDHFDADPTLTSKLTIWENISQTPELSEFASILSRVYFSTSESNTTSQTYSDLFNHDQTFTVWAPKNGTFDYESWNSLLESGDRESVYKVETELIRNCMTRYSHVMSGGDEEKIIFFNGKQGHFNCGKGTINGVTITDSNIGCSNGVVHIIEGPVPYLPNVYEYLSKDASLSRLNAFLKKYESIEFVEDASTQGPTIDGNITWVDSVTTLRNTYFNYLRAYINREDSSYVMIMPTDDCWDATYAKTKNYFNYRTNYSQQVITVDPQTLATSTETKTTTLSDEEMDSIIDFRTSDAISRNLVFNHNWQFGHDYVDMMTENRCDSIESTAGVIFYDPYSARLFNHVTPIELSNGYAFVVDNFNYRMEDTWFDTKLFTYEAERYYESYEYCTIERVHKETNIKYRRYGSEDGEQLDTLLKYTAIKLAPTRTTANPTVKFRLPDTYSCKYDIYAVMIYNLDQMKPYHLRAYMYYHDKKATQEKVQLTPPSGVNADGKNFVTTGPHYDEAGLLHQNDTLLLQRDFELPICYYGLDDAYATLEIQSYLTSSQRSKYTNEVLIDKIILVPKENNEE